MMEPGILHCGLENPERCSQAWKTDLRTGCDRGQVMGIVNGSESMGAQPKQGGIKLTFSVSAARLSSIPLPSTALIKNVLI